MKIAVLDDYQQVAKSCANWEELPSGTEIEFFHDHIGDEDILVDRLRRFEVLVVMRERTDLPSHIIERLKGLRLIVTTGMRNSSIDLQAAQQAGIVVSGTASNAWPTVELAWALLLSLSRQIVAEDTNVRRGVWQQSVGTDLHGKLLGVVGLGRLGTKVAEIGRSFGMATAAWSPHLTPNAAKDRGAAYLSKESLFQRADFISVHMVLADSTRGLIGEEELGLMKASAYLVNTSRGAIIDQDALLRALREGWIAGAGIDVFEDEPLGENHPLCSAPRTVLTPHLGYVTEDNYHLFYSEALEDIQAFDLGRPIRVLWT